MARNIRKFGRVDHVGRTNTMNVLGSKIALRVQKRAELALDLPSLVYENDSQLNDSVPKARRKTSGFSIDNGVQDELPQRGRDPTGLTLDRSSPHIRRR